MNRETSLYLDVVRFSAAMVVMIGHLSGARFTGGLLWQLGRFMDDAVIMFFVLSGFVIAYVVRRREGGLREYAIARTARIYSVALPALVVTFALDAIGRAIAPELYSPSWGYHAENLPGQFLAGLFFANQLWCTPVPTGSMLPYWSLGFEVWYYVFFAIIFFVRSPRKILFFAIACAVAGPCIVALFPIWMLGYWCHGFSNRHRPRRSTGLVLLAASVIGYAAYHHTAKQWLFDHPPTPDSLGLKNIVPHYVAALLCAMHLLGFVWSSEYFSRILKPLHASIRWLAGATFTIYLFHIPVAQFLTTIMPWPPSDGRTRVAILGGTLLLMFVIAEFTERRKDIWIRWVTAAFRKIPAR